MKKLNKEQLEAVNHKNGPLMIIAGAGTGKTTVITERVKHLVTSGLASPTEILALTFTEKAANEMEARIDEAMPYGYTQMWILTFHGFCDRVLRADGHHIGIDTSYKLLTATESLGLLKKNLYELNLKYFAPLGNPTKFLFGLINHFSRLQDENIRPEEYIEWVKKNYELRIMNYAKTKKEEEKLELEKWRELSSAYKKYEEIKIKNSYFDFGDLVTYTIQLFKERPNVLKEYSQKFKYILVDEYQDTNYSQNELTKLLAGEKANISVVLDDDQSVYKFRGAAISNALQFRKHFPKTKIVTLTRNYRSYQNILDSAHTLISHNNPDRLEIIEKIDKKLIAEREGIGEIKFNLLNTSTDEAEFVASKIIELNKNNKYNFNDFAILVRANSHADSFIRALDVANVPYQFLGPSKLFLEPLILDLISYIRVIADPTDDASLYRVLSNPVFELSSFNLLKLMSKARHTNTTLYELTSEENVHKILELISKHIAKRNLLSGEALLEFLMESGLREKMISENSNEALVNIQNIEKLFNKIKNFETLNPGASAREFVDYVDLQTELGESPSATDTDWEYEDKVNILTVHSSKGLEFPVVFLVNLVSQRFPTNERREQIPIPEQLISENLPIGDFHLQEERRLFYVGMTRARDRLFMTGAKFYGDGKREKKVSQFVEETGMETRIMNYEARIKNKNTKKTEKEKQENKGNRKLIVKSLSYSAIETFKICPLHYKLHYLLGIPTPPTPSQSMGVSFHDTLKYFFEEISHGVKPNRKLLSELLTTSWRREGYLSKKHMDEAFKNCEGFLDYFYENYFDKNNLPIGLEQQFNFKIKDLLIKGKIDRIDKTANGIHIIDYKTGANVVTQKEADNSLQMSIYALAATKVLEKPFGVKPENITLSFYYFENPQIVTTHRTKRQLEEAEEEILEWRAIIENSDFNCSGNFLCQNCEFKTYCSASQNDG